MQLNNLVWSFAVTSSTAEKRMDSFHTAVEKNTEQFARLVEELSLLCMPGNATLALTPPTTQPDDTPSPSTPAPEASTPTTPSMPPADDLP